MTERESMFLALALCETYSILSQFGHCDSDEFINFIYYVEHNPLVTSITHTCILPVSLADTGSLTLRLVVLIWCGSTSSNYSVLWKASGMTYCKDPKAIVFWQEMMASCWVMFRSESEEQKIMWKIVQYQLKVQSETCNEASSVT